MFVLEDPSVLPYVLAPVIVVAIGIVVAIIIYFVTRDSHDERFYKDDFVSGLVCILLVLTVASAFSSSILYSTESRIHKIEAIYAHYGIEKLSSIDPGETTITFKKDDALFVVDGYITIEENEFTLYSTEDGKELTPFDAEQVSNSGAATEFDSDQ